MKRCKLLILFTLITILASAQVKNYLGVTAQLGEYSLLSKLDVVPLNGSLGGGASIGGVYELRYKKHFLFDLGLNFQASHTVFFCDTYSATLKDQIDDQGDKLNYIYYVDERKDNYTSLDLQVPIMLGGEWNKFYFMAGVKLDMSVYAPSKTTSLLSAQGEYHKYIGMFENMPQHQFFSKYPLSTTSTIHFNPEVLASFEIGWRLGEVYKGTGFDVPKQKKIYRLAFFADYGLPIMDRHNAVNSPASLQTPNKFYPNEDMSQKIVLNGLLQSSDAPNRVNSLFVGLKFTCLFQLPEPRKCVICKDAYQEHMKHQRVKGHYYTLVGKEKKH